MGKEESYSAKRKGQMKISFGMIFSIILIVIFLAFAFYVISKFVSTTTPTKVLQFENQLQDDVNSMLKSDYGSDERTYSIPKVDQVCFVDFSLKAKGIKASYYDELKFYSRGGENNLVFYPAGKLGDLSSVNIDYLNVKKMTENENPYCINIVDGKIRVRVSINEGENSVTVSR